jgi:hypothetical protein
VHDDDGFPAGSYRARSAYIHALHTTQSHVGALEKQSRPCAPCIAVRRVQVLAAMQDLPGLSAAMQSLLATAV